jgi:hypothetical protein
MPTCKAVSDFLTQVSTKRVTTTLSAPDAALLSQLNMVQFLTSEQVAQITSEVQALGTEQQAISQENWQLSTLVDQLTDENRRTHSILFRLEGKAKQAAEVQRQAEVQSSVQSIQNDLVQKARALGDLIAKRSLLDTLTPYSSGSVAITGVGILALRGLGVSMYRVSDTEFQTYWVQTQQLSQRLYALAGVGAEYFARLQSTLPQADRSNLWGISIGLSKKQPDVPTGTATFTDAYDRIGNLTSNTENRLMASEILFSMPPPLEEEIPALSQVVKDVRKADVPKDSALGVAAILLLGRRQDGTVALPNLTHFLSLTRSYESAAVLAIMNVPTPPLDAKFQSLRSMFGGWGYQPSEDVELSAAYLAVSDVPVEGISTKLAIIAKGVQTYLQYPLVAASVLASVSTLEANETLAVLEQAYEIVGRRAMPMTQSELICLAVRMVEEIRDGLVGGLDTTATQATPTGPGYYRPGPIFIPLFVPLIVANHAYYSTFSGIGGIHPGHVHGFGGGGGGFSG